VQLTQTSGLQERKKERKKERNKASGGRKKQRQEVLLILFGVEKHRWQYFDCKWAT